MKILLLHNKYQLPGGEDEVFCREAELLRSNGHQVVEYVRDNDEIRRYGILRKATLLPRTIWAYDTVNDLKSLIAREKPRIAHFHNTFPLISPAAYKACNDAGVPVVQTLHNPRLLCPAATLFRGGALCEECVAKSVAWPGVLHGCYRGSRIQTAVVAAMLSTHRALDTWKKSVSAFICTTNFYRQKFIQAGLPADKVWCKPHFVAPDPGIRPVDGSYALFVGRLAEEKGVGVLVDAWKRLPGRPIKIRGDGPLLPAIQQLQTRGGSVVELLSRLDKSELVDLIKGARFLVWPSLGYYETFGLIAIEAFACGVPVIASRIGVMQEIVQDGQTGVHFTPGSPADLAEKVEWAWTHPTEMQVMGRNARSEYLSKYTADRNYQQLIQLYRRAVGSTADAHEPQFGSPVGGQDAVRTHPETRFS